LSNFYSYWEKGETNYFPNTAEVKKYSRTSQISDFSKLLNEII
jgi:hypothetical protein